MLFPPINKKNRQLTDLLRKPETQEYLQQIAGNVVPFNPANGGNGSSVVLPTGGGLNRLWKPTNPTVHGGNGSGRPIAANDKPETPAVFDLAGAKEDFETDVNGQNPPFSPDALTSLSALPPQPAEYPNPTDRQQRKTDEILEQINQTQTAPAPRESKLWNRIVKGVFDGINAARANGNTDLGGTLMGAATGATMYGASKGIHAENQKQQKLAQLWNGFNQAAKVEEFQTAQSGKQAQIENVYADNQRAAEEFAERMKYNRDEQERKIDDRASRENTSRMNAVAGMVKNLPVYDPTDPKFAEITQALKDVNLPVTPKDAKKKIDLKQDQRTGEWTVILTDPMNGKQEVRSVMKEGKAFKSTPTVVMQGELGLIKQNDQQEFQAGENAKNRELRTQALKIARERVGIANENLRIAQERLTLAQGKDKRQAEIEVRKAKETLIRLKTYLKNSPYIDSADPIFGEIDELDQ